MNHSWTNYSHGILEPRRVLLRQLQRSSGVAVIEPLAEEDHLDGVRDEGSDEHCRNGVERQVSVQRETGGGVEAQSSSGRHGGVGFGRL